MAANEQKARAHTALNLGRDAVTRIEYSNGVAAREPDLSDTSYGFYREEQDAAGHRGRMPGVRHVVSLAENTSLLKSP